MAKVDVIMPQMGESIAEGTITRWLKQVGDKVERDESLLEISTDKVDADIPSPAAGTLAEILVEEGVTVEIGTTIARLETEAGAAVEAPGDGGTPEPKAEPAPATRAPAPAAVATARVDGDGGAGARYWSNDIVINIVTESILPGPPSTDTIAEVQDWWDPELGLALHFPITPVVGFSIRATGGGFGIGNASNFMWDGEFTALFRVSRRFLVSAGYRQFRYTRTEGEPGDEIDTKVSVVGPQIGFSFGIF